MQLFAQESVVTQADSVLSCECLELFSSLFSLGGRDFQSRHKRIA
jgi:hypothetical protein